MNNREEFLIEVMWNAKAELENRAGDLERQAKSLRQKANELRIILDPPLDTKESKSSVCITCGGDCGQC